MKLPAMRSMTRKHLSREAKAREITAGLMQRDLAYTELEQPGWQELWFSIFDDEI